ncbi:hypothetical protein LY76DRAFT_468373, partial [Colletotrichum caudatum]
MRCPGPPCNLGPHCWIDVIGAKKHYKLRSHHFRAIVRHVEQGGVFDTYSDLPDDIRDQLYAEEQQHAERQRKTNAPSTGNYPPINITNVMPGSSPVASPATGAATPLTTSSPACCTAVLDLEIAGPRDVAVRKYCEWQCSQVESEALKLEFWKAYNAALDHGFDLEQVYEDQRPEFFIEQGVKAGMARRFVCDIKKWVEKYSTA